jgi:deoxyinosine 3'endonuclease (endonuclease V)
MNRSGLSQSSFYKAKLLETILSHPWSLSVGEVETLQARFAGLVERSDRLPRIIGRVAGADVAYETGGDRLFAAVVTQDPETLAILETGTHEDLACFRYMPGLFHFGKYPRLPRHWLSSRNPPIC